MWRLEPTPSSQEVPRTQERHSTSRSSEDLGRVRVSARGPRRVNRADDDARRRATHVSHVKHDTPPQVQVGNAPKTMSIEK